MHGNPWLPSSMSCKSRLYSVEKDKFKIILIMHTHSSRCWHYYFSLLWLKIRKALLRNSLQLLFLETWRVFRGWSERLEHFVGILWNSIFEGFRLRGGGSELGAFGWNAMLTINHNDELRLMMSWWSSGVSGEVGRSWRYHYKHS